MISLVIQYLSDIVSELILKREKKLKLFHDSLDSGKETAGVISV